jgi:hypothetical protein
MAAYNNQMACGILVAYPSFNRGHVTTPSIRSYVQQMWDLPLRDARLPAENQIDRAFSILELDHETRAVLRTSLSHRHPDQRLPAFTDVLGLWSDWLPLPGNKHTNIVDNPFPIPVTTMGNIPESRMIWMIHLRQQRATLSDPKKQMLEFLES